jgi:hypothetical protein
VPGSGGTDSSEVSIVVWVDGRRESASEAEARSAPPGGVVAGLLETRPTGVSWGRFVRSDGGTLSSRAEASSAIIREAPSKR